MKMTIGNVLMCVLCSGTLTALIDGTTKADVLIVQVCTALIVLAGTAIIDVIVEARR